jgi:nucleoside-diphosphate-sugar epimerase
VKKILVTGANGFVGRHLCAYLLKQGYEVRAAVRHKLPKWQVCEQVAVGDIHAHTQWHDALDGVDGVIHLAGRAHVMKQNSNDALALFRQVNVEGSQRLAQQALAAGVQRMIYLSSIKVNGERSAQRPLTSDDRPAPEDPYGRSKWEAEQALTALTLGHSMALVIVRPVLIYGHGVKGNLLRLSGLIRKGWPLPLRSINNRRSLVSIENLLDFLHCCLQHQAAVGEVFLVADHEDLSTPQLIEKMAKAMGYSPRLVPFPVVLLRLIGYLTGRSADVERLCGDLSVDISKNEQLLGWTPKVSVDEALGLMFPSEDLVEIGTERS